MPTNNRHVRGNPTFSPIRRSHRHSTRKNITARVLHIADLLTCNACVAPEVVPIRNFEIGSVNEYDNLSLLTPDGSDWTVTQSVASYGKYYDVKRMANVRGRSQMSNNSDYTLTMLNIAEGRKRSENSAMERLRDLGMEEALQNLAPPASISPLQSRSNNRAKPTCPGHGHEGFEVILKNKRYVNDDIREKSRFSPVLPRKDRREGNIYHSSYGEVRSKGNVKHEVCIVSSNRLPSSRKLPFVSRDPRKAMIQGRKQEERSRRDKSQSYRTKEKCENI